MKPSTMEIHEYTRYRIPRFWDDSYKELDYINRPFNDPDTVKKWLEMGFQPKITGELVDMNGVQPSWNTRMIKFFEDRGFNDIGTTYYRMTSGTVMPTHQDLYLTYVNRFGLQGKENCVHRAIVFLEDWRPGHYLDIVGEPIVKWRAGDVVEWRYDAPHTAANIGFEDRYTLQVTGWKKY